VAGESVPYRVNETPIGGPELARGLMFDPKQAATKVGPTKARIGARAYLCHLTPS